MKHNPVPFAPGLGTGVGGVNFFFFLNFLFYFDKITDIFLWCTNDFSSKF